MFAPIVFLIVSVSCCVSLSAGIAAAEKSFRSDDYFASKVENLLTLENSQIRVEYLWNDGDLVCSAIEDKAAGQVWNMLATKPDFAIPGVAERLSGGSVTVAEVAATPIAPKHLAVTVTASAEGMDLRRVFRIYRDGPSIACDYALRGMPPAGWVEKVEQKRAGTIEPDVEWPRQAVLGAVELGRLEVPGPHWRVTAVRFRQGTDRNNTLVAEDSLLLFKPHQDGLVGNVLFADHLLRDEGLFLLKEAPDFKGHLAYPGGDFVTSKNEIRAVGLGLTPEDVDATEWVPGYSLVIGVTHGGALGRLTALRTYQENWRTYAPNRDDMVLMNTWGDGHKDTRLSFEFVLAELEAGARLGVSRVQIDLGWQTAEWTPRPARFPNGFDPIAKRAEELGVEVALWFAPNLENDYARWQENANALIGFYKDFGIRTFKFDAVNVTDKTAERNLRKLFDALMEGTDYEAVVNYDMTALTRTGYVFFYEYGNVFLENRYTNAGTYYPHWALRNLWMLSSYVAPQRFQIEFLNKWRNTEKYPDGDVLAPANYPFDYVFATTMMAQPLAWLEGTGLPEEAFEIAPLVNGYRDLQASIHSGQIFPIGEEPCGTGWTGFQSIRENGGYILVFREFNERPEALVQTWLPAGTKVRFKARLGHGKDFQAAADGDGRIPFRLDTPRSFALYEYTVE